MVHLIPMAGRGNRFFQEKYRIPKPFVPILGKPMFLAALESFPAAERVIFLVRSEHIHRYNVRKWIQNHVPAGEILEVPEVTEGPACTCLLAEERLAGDEPLYIASCDYQVLYPEARYRTLCAHPDIDVIVWTFKIGSIKKADPKAFAYCRLEGERVTQIREKETISPDPYQDAAVVGSFTFRRSDLFFRGVQKMIRNDVRVNGEFYVATSINQLIEEGCRVVSFEVDQFVSFGNPFELMNFEYWEDYFESLEGHPYTGHFKHRKMRR